MGAANKCEAARVRTRIAPPYEAQNHHQSAIVGAAIGRPQSFTPCLPQKFAAPFENWSLAQGVF